MAWTLTILFCLGCLPAFTQLPVSAAEKRPDTGYYSNGQSAFYAGRFDEAIDQNQHYLDEAIQKKDRGQIFQALTGMFGVSSKR